MPVPGIAGRSPGDSSNCPRTDSGRPAHVRPPRPAAVARDPPCSARRWSGQGWQATIAPSYIGLFLWVVYFDQLAGRTLATGGLGWSVVGAGVAGLLCYRLLYLRPGHVGLQDRPAAGRPGVEHLRGSGLGLDHGRPDRRWPRSSGSPWRIDYAVDWTFQGLVSCRLLDPKYLRPIRVGGLRLESPLFLVTALAWSFATALTGHYLMQIIAALMNVFPVIPALLLGLAMVLTFRGLPEFQPPEIDPATRQPVRDGGPRALAMMVQMVFGFFATAGRAGGRLGDGRPRSPRRRARRLGRRGVRVVDRGDPGPPDRGGCPGRLPAAPGLANAPGWGTSASGWPCSWGSAATWRVRCSWSSGWPRSARPASRRMSSGIGSRRPGPGSRGFGGPCSARRRPIR